MKSSVNFPLKLHRTCVVRTCVVGLLLLAAAGGAGCVTTKEMMTDAVLMRAQQDLVCDQASVKTRRVGVVSRYKSERQGTVERATYSAEGCGDSEVYTVECIRGVCFAVQDKPPKEKQKSIYDERTEP